MGDGRLRFRVVRHFYIYFVEDVIGFSFVVESFCGSGQFIYLRYTCLTISPLYSLLSSIDDLLFFIVLSVVKVVTVYSGDDLFICMKHFFYFCISRFLYLLLIISEGAAF